MTEGQCALHDQGIQLPPSYYAAVTALQNLSPRTLCDPVAMRDWLDVLAVAGSTITDGVRAQHALQLHDFPDRLADYTRISVPSLVIAFADDLMVPRVLSREVADAIPGARYLEIPGCGHFGYLERPAEVNDAIVKFLADQGAQR